MSSPVVTDSPLLIGLSQVRIISASWTYAFCDRQNACVERRCQQLQTCRVNDVCADWWCVVCPMPIRCHQTQSETAHSNNYNETSSVFARIGCSGNGSVNQSDSPLVMCSVSRNRTYPIQRWMFCASGSLRIEHHSCADTVGFLCSGSARRKCIVLYAAFDVMHHIG